MPNQKKKLSNRLAIPPEEISFRFSRSSGPGGQNVNRVESRVELLFDVKSSPTLTDAQRRTIFERLASHIDGDGILHIVSQISRSQIKNREDALIRLQGLLSNALKPRKKRRATRPTKAARERRLQEKKKKGESKKLRKRVEPE